jgi:hypothetical protein
MYSRGDNMDPRIKIIYIRQLGGTRTLTIKNGVVASRLKEWPGHTLYTNEEILKCLKMGVGWHV